MNFSTSQNEEKESLLPGKNSSRVLSFSDDDNDCATNYGSLGGVSRKQEEYVADGRRRHNAPKVHKSMDEQGSDLEGLLDNMETQHQITESDISINDKAENTGKGFLKRLQCCKLNSKVSDVIVYGLLPVIIWGVIFLIVGKDDLPGGNMFLLVLLECGGRLLGYLGSLLYMPPMVGMLGLGLAVRNVEYLDLTHFWSPSLSAPIRQIALAIILTRAGFGLDINTLLKFKWLVLKLAMLPTILEAGAVTISVVLLLGFPWIWGILVGFVVAAVSPAVIVPRILDLKAQGYGEAKGIPTVVLAAASLDNVVAISLFGVALGFIFSSDKGTAAMILQCPLEVISGCGFGLAWGAVTAFVFNPSKNSNADDSVIKGIFVLSGGLISIFGFKYLNFSGAGALGCIISAFVTCTIWKARGFQESEINQIKWGLTFFWKFFEPLLFGVIGCQIVINDLEGRTVLLSIACLIIGATVRFIITYGAVSCCGLDTKEKLFIAISWIPKATVQAAIGPTALDYARGSASHDATAEQLAMQVLTIAVVVILLTAPIGEFAVIYTGPRFLKKEDNTEIENTTSNGSAQS